MPNPSRPRTIATQLVAIAHAYLECRVTDEALVKRLRRLADQIESSRSANPSPKELEDKADQEGVRRIFEHWKKRMTKPKAKLTDGRKRVIRARLKDGYTIQQIKQAIDACSSSEFHMGDNDRKTVFNDLTLILRSGEKLEFFLEHASNVDPEVNHPPEIRRLQLEAADAMKRGDTDAYNDANARIRDVRATG